ncbi:uncharacterized protein LOC122033445 [Zingiber officinale]|uniref:uncharacterized protein LOC122033445 n=1 Tax=Zingiber officinale TaxID=94328 RepID=UPI001C4B4524|nr:uncharacterized protein LOC122033445 [Zingiber officinale]
MDCCDKLLSESGIIWSVLNAVYTKFSLIQGLEDAVDKLQRTQNSIQCLLIDAEALDIVNEAVKGWVCDMKTVAFDAENIIDEFQTLVDITKHAEAPSRRRKRSIPYLGGFMTLVKRRRIAEDIAKIEDRLDEIRKSRMNLGLEPSDGQRRSNGSNEMVCIPTSAKFDESRIFGRTKECDSVVAALKAKSVSNLHIVVIHDLPGIGYMFQEIDAPSTDNGNGNDRHIQNTCVTSDEGLYEGFDWLSSNIKKSKLLEAFYLSNNNC